jgi:hypothetical protein
MSDNPFDDSYKIETMASEIKDIKRSLASAEQTLQEIRNNTSALADIKDYLYELKNK